MRRVTQVFHRCVTSGARCQHPLTIALLFLALASAACAQTFDRLVIFGDSLSDPGNYFVAFHSHLVPPFQNPVPDAPYAIGGNRFTNGPTWAEQLSRALHLPSSGKPALRAPGVFTNYAVGRARARAGATAFPAFDLTTQVNQFLADGGKASRSDLFVIWIGANDLDDALHDQASAGNIFEAALTAVANNIRVLYGAGARTFLIPSVPNLGMTPVVHNLGPAVQMGAAQATAMYNSLLDQQLAQLSASPELSGIHFIRLDINAVFTALVAAHPANGLVDVVDSCLTFGVIADAVCDRPDTYLFWDGIHPTRKGHSFIAKAALAALFDASDQMADEQEFAATP
jgi:outer membrane lipase/esterase